MLLNHLVLCCLLLLLPSIFPSIRVFSSESVLCIRWPKYWSFSFRISPSNEYSGLISFRMDWLDLFAVQETLKSFIQYHSSKASILWYSVFFIVQLSHPYTTTGKTIALTRWTFVIKVMSLLFNMLSRLVIAFLPRSNHLLILWLQSPSAVILEAKKIKSVTVFIVSPCICHEVSNQGYGFSRSLLWMWELDHIEGWAPKNWWFWSLVLEKTLESPLDCKEIQPVSPKGSQSWIFIGRTDEEAEAPILWPPDGNSRLIGKDPNAGKDWRQGEKGMTEDEMVGWHQWLNGCELEQAPGVGDGQGSLACCSPWSGKEWSDRRTTTTNW